LGRASFWDAMSPPKDADVFLGRESFWGVTGGDQREVDILVRSICTSRSNQPKQTWTYNFLIMLKQIGLYVSYLHNVRKTMRDFTIDGLAQCQS
jgi:hypothetical protein